MQGVGESMSPAILGFSCLTLAAALVSVGLFRAGGEMAVGGQIKVEALAEEEPVASEV